MKPQLKKKRNKNKAPKFGQMIWHHSPIVWREAPPEVKEGIRQAKLQFDFSQMEVAETQFFSFTREERAGVRGYSNGSTKPEYVNRACSYVNCANHWASRFAPDRKFVVRMVYFLNGNVSGCEVVRVR